MNRKNVWKYWNDRFTVKFKNRWGKSGRKTFRFLSVVKACKFTSYQPNSFPVEFELENGVGCVQLVNLHKLQTFLLSFWFKLFNHAWPGICRSPIYKYASEVGRDFIIYFLIFVVINEVDKIRLFFNTIRLKQAFRKIEKWLEADAKEDDILDDVG